MISGASPTCSPRPVLSDGKRGLLRTSIFPHPHEVSIEPVPKGDRIHPANADALGPVEPFVTIVRGCECGRDHERRKLREIRAKRAGVTVDAEVEPPAVREIDARACSRLQASPRVDDRHAVRRVPGGGMALGLPRPDRKPLPALSREYREEITNMRFEIQAFDCEASDPGLANAPWAIKSTPSGIREFLVNSGSDVFKSATMTPLDALLGEIAWQVPLGITDDLPAGKKYSYDPQTGEVKMVDAD